MACGDDFQPEGGGGSGGSTSSSSTTSASGMGGFEGCASDDECAYAVEWCVGGMCVPCDKGGEVCDISCTQGWAMYERHGCTPCDCAPTNPCVSDEECPQVTAGPSKCYAGNHCWDWCPAGDPSCCYGNQCAAAGCPDPILTGCQKTGCAPGMTCVPSGCEPSACHCDGANWECTDDCNGGECAPS